MADVPLMNNPMTTAQDIIKGGASGAPARLAVGSNGDVLTVTAGSVGWAAPSAGSGISSGTSFPDSPTTGDLYHRTDLTPGLYRYDGTRWRCTCVHEVPIPIGESLSNFSTSGTTAGRLALPSGTLWLIDWVATTYVSTTNSGTAYWTNALRDDALTTIVSFNTSADSANTATRHTTAIGATSTALWVDVNSTKTSTPGTLRVPSVLRYQHVAT